MKILSGTSNRPLADKIAAYLGVPITDALINRFPDGEVWVKIQENVRGGDVYIVQSTSQPANENIMELLIMIDAARRASASRITAVLPFYGYARQDRKDQPRVPITAKLVANLLVAAGTDRVLTLDLHAQQIQGFFDIPADHLYAAPVIVKYLREKNLDNLTVVSPDTGGVKMASAYANMLSAGLAIVAKQRTSPTEVEVMNVVGEVKGRNCVLVDDLASTAGTLSAAANTLHEMGATSIMAAVSHAMLQDAGFKRLQASPITELVTTDSIPHTDWHGLPVAEISVSEMLGEAIRRVHENQSVTSLFNV